MKITIYEDRSYSKDYFQNEGTKFENKATTLLFDLPEVIEGYNTSELNKYIVFDIDCEQNKDILTSENTYILPNSITELGKVKFNLYLVEASTGEVGENLFQWISKEIVLNFNKATEAKEVIVTEQEIDIFNSLVSELNGKIAEVSLLEEDFEAAITQVENLDIDVSKTGSTATVTITNKEGIEKSVNIEDGQKGDKGDTGDKGDDYVITQEDYQEIAGIVEEQIEIPSKTSDLENDSGFIDNTVNDLQNYYKKSETYTKQEIDSKVSSVYKYKGTVASYSNLPSTGLTIGDVYNVEDTGDNYAWTGTDWDKLGGDIDLSGYQTKIDSTHKLSSDLVDDTGNTNKFVTSTDKTNWNAKYDKPNGGIPKTDLTSDVQTSLGKADTAIQDISSKQDITDNSLETTNKTVPGAINEVNSIAKGANQAVSYGNYSTMVTTFNSLANNVYNVGQNVMIVTLNVPDLWISGIESTSQTYTYTTDEAFTTELNTNGYVQVGYYKLSALETQKVDLTNYVTNTDFANNTTAGVIRTSASYGTTVSGSGVLNASTLSYEAYTGANNTTFVGKGTLENVIEGKGLISNTDYATSATGGVIKLGSSYGTTITSSGNLRATAKTYEEYSSAGSYMFIGKGTLENVITGKGLIDTSKVKNTNSTTAGDVYDVRYINTMIGNIETLLAEV